MSGTSRKGWVRIKASELDPKASAARLRRTAGRPIDTSDIPEIIDFSRFGESHRIPKKSVTLRLDAEVLRFFRAQGPGYQTRINRVLRAAMGPKDDLRRRLYEAAALLEQVAEKV